MKILILGCGNVGASLAIGISKVIPSIGVTVADINFELAASVARKIGSSAVARKVDIFNESDLIELIKGHYIVFNVCGPFYKTAIPVLEASLQAGVNYLDINDDDDVAKKIFDSEKYDEVAKRNNCVALIGCGGSPGFTNVLAKHASTLLDRTDTIRFCWIVPYLPKYFSSSVIDHMFHMLTDTVTQYVDGRHVLVKPFEGVREVRFLEPFATYPAYYSGHAEPITLPRYVDGVKEVTIRSYFFPEKIDSLIKSMALMGLGSREKIENIKISPIEFMKEFLKYDSNKSSLFENTIVEPFGYATQVEVSGARGDDFVRIIYEDHGYFDIDDESVGGGEVGITSDPTAICAQLVLEEVIRGNIKEKGVWSPEGCLNTKKYIEDVIINTGKKIQFKEEVLGKFR